MYNIPHVKCKIYSQDNCIIWNFRFHELQYIKRVHPYALKRSKKVINNINTTSSSKHSSIFAKYLLLLARDIFIRLQH